MSKKTDRSGGTSLVIVESPAKARTIGKFLGPGYTIEASIGHIRDLPQGAKEIPAEFKGEDWAYLGVNVHKDFDPVYVIPRDKIAQVRKLKALLKGAKDLYLATDEDREGEAISWHLCEVLQPKVPVHRLVFHEITEEAIRQALEQPREIDNDLVRAQEVRRIVDRLYGYDVSPLLWRKIRSRLSAGRVQSVAVRLIVQRERQRMSFVSATYWDLLGQFAKIGGAAFEATLISHQGRGIPSSRDFDPADGRLKDAGLLLLDERQARELAERIARATCRVSDLDDKPYTTRPYPPFTTSTLQQEANRKYGFTARHTMQAAQSLYETGHITYMRTDSTNLAAVAVQTARQLVASQYGPEYLPDQPRYYQTKVKNAQEAHEAIRPAGHPFDFPETLRAQLSLDQFKLYDLIWKRTVASQMADARGRRITISVEADGAVFQASGRTIDFPGYLRAYVEGSDDPESRLADRDVVLPGVTVGETLECRGIEPKSHTTQPPNRYSEASLTRALEEMGIGRPSTYAQIIDTILAREYVFKSKRGNVLVPTWTAFAVSQLLEVHLPNLVDYQFTAEMEDELDAISRGELSHLEYLHRFYFGNDHPGLKEQLKNKVDEINARDVSRLSVGRPEGQAEVFVRVGRYGPFLEQGDRHAAVPDNMPPEELTLAVALEMLDKATQSDVPLGVCPQTHEPVFVKVGRFGPYVQRGTGEGDQKPQNVSLLKGMNVEDVTLEVALKLLSLPRTLGENTAGQPVAAYNGRFGPYVKCGEETRSLPAGLSPLDVTLQQALDLLAQPKPTGGRGARKEPLKVFDPSPVTEKPVQLLAGRYGPYVTDGATNASLPRGTTVEEVTLEYALSLLKARAERGPSARPARGRRGVKSAASAPAAKRPAKKTATKSAKKRVPRKKAAKKKTAPK
jgi:DNA topoisomerase-1